MLQSYNFVISIQFDRESTSCMVIYGYKHQKEALEAFEEQYFGSYPIWKTNVLFFKGKEQLEVYGTKFKSSIRYCFSFFVGVYFYLQPFNSLFSFFYSSEHKIVAVLENNTKNKL